jgi:hypothetical protein
MILGETTLQKVEKNYKKIYRLAFSREHKKGLKKILKRCKDERARILMMQLDVNQIMEVVIMLHFFPKNDRNSEDLRSLVLSKLSFLTKLDIIKKLGYFRNERKFFYNARKLNEARNVVAHTSFYRKPKVNGKGILTKKNLKRLEAITVDSKSKINALWLAIQATNDAKVLQNIERCFSKRK